MFYVFNIISILFSIFSLNGSIAIIQDKNEPEDFQKAALISLCVASSTLVLNAVGFFFHPIAALGALINFFYSLYAMFSMFKNRKKTFELNALKKKPIPENTLNAGIIIGFFSMIGIMLFQYGLAYFSLH